MRPFLPPLLAGALARGDLGIDFDGTGWRFLEAPGFLLAILALAVLSYGAERSGRNRPSFRGEEGPGESSASDGGALDASRGEATSEAVGTEPTEAEQDVGAAELAAAAAERAGGAPGRGPSDHRRLGLALAALGVVLGALLFAGSLAESGREAWPGFAAGAACAVLAYASVGALFDRARARLDESGAALLMVYADGAALALAAVAVVLPPLSFLALAGCVLMLAKTRERRGRKYAGLRVLR